MLFHRLSIVNVLSVFLWTVGESKRERGREGVSEAERRDALTQETKFIVSIRYSWTVIIYLLLKQMCELLLIIKVCIFQVLVKIL